MYTLWGCWMACRLHIAYYMQDDKTYNEVFEQMRLQGWFE